MENEIKQLKELAQNNLAISTQTFLRVFALEKILVSKGIISEEDLILAYNESAKTYNVISENLEIAYEEVK